MEEGMLNASEYLSKDMLDEDFLKMFEPFRRFQIMLGSCRVDARNRFVTTPTVFQKIYTVLLIIVLFAMYSATIFYAGERYHTIHHLHILALVIVYVQFVFYVLSIINARFFCNGGNMKFYIKLSHVDKVLDVDFFKAIKNTVYKINCLSLLCLIFILCVVIGLVIYINNIYFTFTVMSFVVTNTTVLMEISSCSNHLSYFGLHLQVLGIILSSHLNRMENNLAKEEGSIVKKYILNTMGFKVKHVKEYGLDDYLKAIFDAYIHFQDVYKFQLFLFTVKVVVFVVLTFEFALLTLQSSNPDRSGVAVLSILTLIDLGVLLLLCFRCELFERNMKNIKLSAIKIMSLFYDGPIRDKAKKMYKIIEETPPRFQIYDMWALEARLFLKICNIVTGLFVTLLQIAFL